MRVRRKPLPDELPEVEDINGAVWKAPDLKATVMDAYFAGLITNDDAVDLIKYYGLENA